MQLFDNSLIFVLNVIMNIRYIVEEVVDKAYELLDRYDMRQVVQVVGLSDVHTIFTDKRYNSQKHKSFRHHAQVENREKLCSMFYGLN